MPSPRTDRILAGHGFLAGSMALWRAVEGTPWLTSERGRGILNHPAGEVLLAVWMLLAVAALVMVVFGTLLERTTILVALAVFLVAALWNRQGFDAFDLAYLLAVPVAIALHVETRRPTPEPNKAPRGPGATLVP